MSGELTVPKETGLQIHNLNVSPLPQMRINCGDENSFIQMSHDRTDVLGIVWNEERIGLITTDRTSIVQFYPEVKPITKIFLRKEESRRKRDMFGQPVGPVVWEGEFTPIVFTKTKLIQFLQTQKSNLPDDVLSAIRNMRITEKKSQQEEMLNLDDEDNMRTVIEEETSTNIPKRFMMTLPVCDGYEGNFEFEAGVAVIEDEYGRKTKRKGIELRCLNAREVLRDMMQTVLEKMPERIPQYYGAMSVGVLPKDGW